MVTKWGYCLDVRGCKNRLYRYSEKIMDSGRLEEDEIITIVKVFSRESVPQSSDSWDVAVQM